MVALVRSVSDARHSAEISDPELQCAYVAAADVCDPEVPVLTLEDLGVLRGVQRDADGQIVVRLTPTYSGCPAMHAMREDVMTALGGIGLANARVELVLAPAWTTDWMSDAGREKLRAYGIAPPLGRAKKRGLFDQESVPCPRCGSSSTEKISEFGSTACKAHWRCLSCSEPFDYFKCL